MSPIILILLVSLAVGAVGMAFIPGIVGGGRADKRIKALTTGERATGRKTRVDPAKARQNRRKSLQDILDDQSEQNKKNKKISLKKRLAHAGMSISVNGFWRNAAILGVVVFLVTWLTGVPILLALVFGAAGAYAVPMWYVKQRTRKYQTRFLDEFPNAVDSIVRGVKAGMPLNESMKVVASESKEPVKTEFTRIIEQQSVGKNVAEAVPILFERLPIAEVNFFVVVITVQQQAGGNLSEALGNLATVLRNRKKMKAKIKAVSSEAKASAGIIGSLPFVVSTLISLVSPTYMLPLFTTPLGNMWLGIAVLMMSFGVFVMHKMIQFDY
ncbi:type II secretion system F family protein [Maritalea sp.]|jgi:tight adherence protein B|uniref:type II secretion system F family protein n=1 Tax=Maritalea sp. TaxID=2003361 RepID=UPI0039E2897D